MANPNILKTDSSPAYYSARVGQEIQRARILSDLEHRHGKHLVLVHYGPRENPWQEWVYNNADIDASNVIWARDMGYLKNQELLRRYPDRHVWYVEHTNGIGELIPYSQIAIPWQIALEHFNFTSGNVAALEPESSSGFPDRSETRSSVQAVSKTRNVNR